MAIGGKKMKIDFNIISRLKDFYKDSSIQARMIKNFGLVVVIVVLLIEIIIISVVHGYYYGGVEQILKERVTLSAEFLNKSANYSSASDKANAMFGMSITSYENKFLVQFIDNDKNLIIDSDGFSFDNFGEESMEINTPDVNSAFENKLVIHQSVNKLTKERILSASRPLMRYNKVDGVIRFVVSLEKVDKQMQQFTIMSLFIGVFIILVFMFISTVISRTIIDPLKKLNETAQEFAKGHFDIRAEKRYDDEVGQLADTMNFMSDEIKNTEKLKVEFISSISHELRTPLTSIKGWSETLQMSEGYKKDSDVAIGLNIISTEAERLSTMVEELLDFSRFQASSMKVIRKPVDLKDIIFQVYRQFSNKRANVTLLYDFKGENTIIYADENRLKQIYINLVTNSIKFTKEGGKIEMIAVGYQDKIVTVVKDNGIGIKEENLPHIKEKFYKGTSTMPGNGLGLAIVDELVKLQDGTIEIESQYEVGTQVTITFPAMEKEEKEEIIKEPV